MTTICVVVLSFIMTTLTTLPSPCDAHGRLMDPPARNSMWRLGFNNPVNYNDNELYCGGRMVQWLRNSGKCGVCGDPFHGKNDHEAGGKYANGIITRSFHEGDELPVTVHLTANHLGWFEFRICPVNDPKKKVTQQCLDKNELQRADGKGTKYFVPKGKYNAFFNYTLLLPKGLTCKQCVIQWKYRTGNTWDKDDKSGLFCLGCGPQEEFYNCADIEILPKGQKSKWNKEQNMRPTSTAEPEKEETKPVLKKISKPIKIVVDSKHDKDKKNFIDKYDKKTTLPAPASKTSKPKISQKSKPKPKPNPTPKEDPKKNSVDNHPNGDKQGKKKGKPKHPQDTKYNWRASTPWLLRRKYLNRRRLGLKQRRLPQNSNNLHKKEQQVKPDPKIQNEPDTTKQPQTKSTTASPTTKKAMTVKKTVPVTTVKTTTPITTVKTTIPPAKPTLRPQQVTKLRKAVTIPPAKPTLRPQQVTKLRKAVTKPPIRKQVIRGPAKSWLISSRKRQQAGFRRTSQAPRQTQRPVFLRTPKPVSRLTTQPVRQKPVITKTTAHNCVTETPETKPVKNSLRPTSHRHHDANVPVQQPKPKTTEHFVRDSGNHVFRHRSTPSITQQRVVSYQPTVSQQHHQNVIPTHEGQLMNSVHQGQGHMMSAGPQDSGHFSHNNNPMMWWNQYQRPVSYFWNRPAVTPLLKCRATITLGGGMDEWCTANCNANFCPGGMCVCQPDHQQSYPSYSMYPPQTQGWGNTFSPSLSQYNSDSRIPSDSRSPFAPRRQIIPRKHNPLQQMRRQKQYRPQQLHRSSSVQTSNSIFGPGSAHSPVLTTPRRDTNRVWAQKGKYYCRATGRYAGLKRFDEWCSKNCMNVICPLLICECNSL